MSAVLAQEAAESGIGSVLFWGLVLLGLLSLLFAAVSYLRKWLKQPEDTSGAGFTLGDLRDMRRQGKISEAEFERARSTIVAAAQRAMARDREAAQKLAAHDGRDGPSATRDDRTPTGHL